MKKENDLYLTDYPFPQLGDTEYKMSPMRVISITKYDGDKYCDIKVHGLFGCVDVKKTLLKTQIKRFYIYEVVSNKKLKKYIIS